MDVEQQEMEYSRERSRTVGWVRGLETGQNSGGLRELLGCPVVGPDVRTLGSWRRGSLSRVSAPNRWLKHTAALEYWGFGGPTAPETV